MFRCLEFGHTFVNVEGEDDTDSIEADDLNCPECGSGIERIAFKDQWDAQCTTCLGPAKRTFTSECGTFAMYKCQIGHEFDSNAVEDARFFNRDYMRTMEQ